MAGLELPRPQATVSTYRLFSSKAAGAMASIKGVRVYDYGQGDCNAIMGADRPVLYFDIGGGKHAGSKSHPWHDDWRKTCAPDLELEPTIVLSHWDGDHHSTAYYIVHHDTTNKNVPDDAKETRDGLCKTLQWLVPRRCKYPSTLAFVRQIKQLQCWPDKVGEHTFELNDHTRVVIERAFKDQNGDFDPNLDGLAIRVERLDADKEVIEQIVMPGDAPYDIIPSLRAKEVEECVGLLAFHHGSETHMDDAAEYIPKPKVLQSGTPKIAYTFGLKKDGERCHHHPAPDAVAKYHGVGWNERGCISGTLDPWPPTDKETAFTVKTVRGDVDLPFITAEPPPPQASATSSSSTVSNATSSSAPAARPQRERKVVLRWSPP
jgi:hypothetical protein